VGKDRQQISLEPCQEISESENFCDAINEVFLHLLACVNISRLFSPVGYMEGFDPDISVDDLRGEPWSTAGGASVASPLKAKSRSASRELLDDVSLPLLADEGPEAAVQLAARTILNHLVNHLNHFPGSCGPASLSSQALLRIPVLNNPNVFGGS
jgi:hypothetical protein